MATVLCELSTQYKTTLFNLDCCDSPFNPRGWYFTHDIPVFTVAPSENYQSWAQYFSYFRILSHHPELLVCDDNINIKMAARAKFPCCRIQTCFNHFKENLRGNLKVRSDKTYVSFMRKIEQIINSSQKLPKLS